MSHPKADLQGARVKSRRVRWSTVLEALVLAALASGLAYVSCRDEAPSAPRAHKVFAAQRSAGGALGGIERRREVEAEVHTLLSRIATGALGEEQRAETQRGLTALLERVDWGTPEGRVAAAGMAVQQMFDQAKLQTPSARVSAIQRQAMSGLAKELTRQMMLVASGSPPGADALAFVVPDGHARVNWKVIGGFQYREGMEVPAEIRALDGARVALPGFMLTLGDTSDIREFVLVESLWGCCFGSVPELNQTLLVRVLGNAIDYSAAPLLVTGVMEVGEERQAGFVTSLYRIRDARVSLLEQAEPSD